MEKHILLHGMKQCTSLFEVNQVRFKNTSACVSYQAMTQASKVSVPDALVEALSRFDNDAHYIL